MFNNPAEIQLFNLYLPPFFLVGMSGLVITLVIVKILNRFGLNRFFWHPPLAFLAMWIMTSSVVGLVLISP